MNGCLGCERTAEERVYECKDCPNNPDKEEKPK